MLSFDGVLLRFIVRAGRERMDASLGFLPIITGCLMMRLSSMAFDGGGAGDDGRELVGQLGTAGEGSLELSGDPLRERSTAACSNCFLHALSGSSDGE